MDALKAAVSAGADACYAGGDMFSARAFAGNFDTTELLEAIDIRRYILEIFFTFKSAQCIHFIVNNHRDIIFL